MKGNQWKMRGSETSKIKRGEAIKVKVRKT